MQLTKTIFQNSAIFIEKKWIFVAGKNVSSGHIT